jgi:hypothetical protein
MGLAKKSTTETLPAGTQDFRTSNSENVGNPQPESGAAAAVARLKTKLVAAEKPAYKARDFDAEARGKTRCVQFEAALMSPAIAGMKFDTMEQYLALVKQAAEAGVAYTFGA